MFQVLYTGKVILFSEIVIWNAFVAFMQKFCPVFWEILETVS